MDLNLSNISPQPARGENPESESVRVLILGSGQAGLYAALYAARANLNPIVLTGLEVGGQVSLTYIVENYPGFPDGIRGMEMVDLFQKETERFGARIEIDYAGAEDVTATP